MKRNLMALILALCLFGTSLAGAEGLLPSLTDTIGKPMPSLGEALGRYPDEENPSADGSNTEVFQGVTETDFNTFSVYLSERKAKLVDYQTVANSFSALIRVEGKDITFTYDTQSMEARVSYPSGTYDEWLDYAKKQFESAVRMLKAGNTDEGMSVLFTIPVYSRYKPVAEYLAAHPELEAIHDARLAPFRKVGGNVTFGRYEQDGDESNGPEPIEWIVLSSENSQAILLSRNIIESIDSDGADPTWENWSLREWLNGDFYRKAFSDNEKSYIILSNVKNLPNPSDHCSSGNDTMDYVYILSVDELKAYFDVDMTRAEELGGTYKEDMRLVAWPSAYVLEKYHPWVCGDTNRSTGEEPYIGAMAWYLRTRYEAEPIDRRYANFAYVEYSGKVYWRSLGHLVDGGVRPVICVSIE